MAPIGPGSKRENSGSGHIPWLNNHKTVQYVHNMISGCKLPDYMVGNSPLGGVRMRKGNPLNG